ncbi:hypothetical protein G6O67_008043 [Ophiocordyceps sinensis]|nr:hypothetical protein G6O67_008043 [Ophiocordyceps sinensis]
MTPFTGRDFERRGVRSAAPTPDTAHPSRKHLLWATQGEDDEDDEDDEADEADEAQTQTQDRSDFQTWFWDNRRELNRSWMTRRKTAAKERRHRDNKARASKAV